MWNKVSQTLQVKLSRTVTEPYTCRTHCYKPCPQKRAKLREDLDLKRYETPSESEGGSDADRGVPGRGVRVFKDDEAVTTVTVTSVFLNSDE